MFKSLRVPEQTFTIIMWIVSIVFAGFLIGLGRLVLGDLPRVTSTPSVMEFVDRGAYDRETVKQRGLDAQRETLRTRIEDANLARQTATNDYTSARDSFDNWIDTRRATTDPKQDPEVIARTKKLDALKETERKAEQAAESLVQQRVELDRQYENSRFAQSELERVAQPALERAQFWADLKVFAIRLAFTLPLLAAAIWAFRNKRKDEYWPLWRGFILFALFAFFVELVPYLPSYGGYIRYLVGIGLTIVASIYLIKWMRHYLANRAVAEQKAEIERKQSIKYEDALKKMSTNICPGCERPTATTGDVLADYCVHCGMQLFDHCKKCDSRKLAFFRYCMKCGTASTPSSFTAEAVAPATPA